MEVKKLNTILKINQDQMIEVEDVGQATIETVRREYPKAHIVLIGFKDVNDGTIIERNLESQYDVVRKL